ncbi:unnamed protein product [Symbiodinium microadriaticum]|nr:unnamed protein product [Symbiodinium microadriaticum]
MAMSKSWSMWAPGLTLRIKRCLRAWLAHSSFAEHQAVSEERAAHLAKLTAEESEYRDHCLRGHIPFCKDCEVCIRASGKDRRHLRQKYGSAYTLSLDLGGPWQKAKDLYQTQHHVLIGTYQFPLLDKPAAEEGFPIPEDVVGVHDGGDDADDVSLEPEDGDIVVPDEHLEASEVEVKKVIESEEAWRALKDHATKPVRMINFMMAVSGGYIVGARGAKDDPDKLVMFPTTVVYDKVVLQEDLEADIPSDDSPSACIVKTCYADDIAKSEELAREWLEQKKFSPQQCLELLESVGLDFRANRRGGIHGNEERVQALAVGQYVRGHMCGVTNATKHRPMFVKYLVSFVREHNPDVAFSSVYLSCNMP